MDIRQIKEIYAGCGFRPNKKLGQNFLADPNIRDKIIESLPLDPDGTVLEIGPGFGVMTFELAKRARRVVAVEKDDRLSAVMAPYFKEAGNIELVSADFLDVDIASIIGTGRRGLVYGNVPYYISTPIMEKVIDSRSSVTGLYMVIQEELASRIASPPGSRMYGSVSCYVQYYTAVRKLFRISRNCFFPRPQVGSCLLGMDMLESPSVDVEDEELMFDLIHKAFWQRRKKIINPLLSSALAGLDREGWEKVMESCGVSSSSRAEDLSLEDYARMANALSAMGGSKDGARPR